ncbi:MAG: hypothetical protein IIA45_03020 [Bacteroidetes bacterium]|nr:hypothetical protein [Bacteroidota bacterium]
MVILTWVIVFLGGIAALLQIIEQVSNPTTYIFRILHSIPIWVRYVVIACGLMAFGFYLGTKQEQPPSKTRIVLMIPCNNDLGEAWEDGVRQILGWTRLLKDNPDYTSRYDFRLIDHHMEYNESLRQTIINEIENGAKYFISTMSNVSVPLSEKFKGIVDESNYEGNHEPILICTIASSPKVKTSKNSVYRFYVRSQEEGEVLAKAGMKLNLQTATFVAVDDTYGPGAVESFKTEWKKLGGTIVDGVMIDLHLSQENVNKKIQSSSVFKNKIDAVFIAHYGSGVGKIFKALEGLNDSTVILATSTLSIKEWQKPIFDILEKRKWITCVPDYKKNNEKYEDIISDFMYFTLERLIRTIEETNGQPNMFDEKWKSLNFPAVLNFEKIDGTDIKIFMKEDQTIRKE